MKHVSQQELADALGVTRRAISKRAAQEAWKSVQKRVRGGMEVHYPIKWLPEQVRTRLARHQATAMLSNPSQAAAAGIEAGNQVAAMNAEEAERWRMKQEAALAAFEELPAEQKEIAYARRDVLQAWNGFLLASAATNKKAGTSQFCSIYNTGSLKISDHIRAVVPKVSRTTLTRWQKDHDERGVVALAPGYHNPNKGATELSAEMQDFILAMLVEHPHLKVITVRECMRPRFSEVPSIGVVNRYITKWKKENASLMLFVTDPDEWKSKIMAAVGSASENISRINQLWELDSTPSELILTDGRYCLIGGIDVYPRRLKLHVSKTSKSTAVAALIRKALLDWGVPEKVKTDNGADYVSRHIVTAFSGLGIEQQLCPPFTPENKPHIERAFKTFAHSFQEMMPGYIGHSVADRKGIEARRSFASRIMGRGEQIEIRLTAAELQDYCDRWVKSIYHHNAHRGLKGLTPAQMELTWRDDIKRIGNERALDILLAEAPDNDGVRTVGKKGVKVNNIFYFGEDMPETGTKVRVKLDATDLGTIYLFDAEYGAFLCVCRSELHVGIDRAEIAAKVKARQKKLVQAGQKELKKIAREQAVANIHDEYLEFREAQTAKIHPLPTSSTDYTTPALNAAAQAAEALDRAKADKHIIPPMVEEEKQKAAPTQATRGTGPSRATGGGAPSGAKKDKVTVIYTDSDRYEQIYLSTKRGKRKLRREEHDFLTRYYQTEAGQMYRRLHKDLREIIGLAGSEQVEG